MKELIGSTVRYRKSEGRECQGKVSSKLQITSRLEARTQDELKLQQINSNNSIHNTMTLPMLSWIG